MQLSAVATPLAQPQSRFALDFGPPPGFPARPNLRLVTGDERAEWWDRAVAAYPDYAAYQEATTREIPVFIASKV
jgi:hypothetical protein